MVQLQAVALAGNEPQAVPPPWSLAIVLPLALARGQVVLVLPSLL